MHGHLTALALLAAGPAAAHPGRATVAGGPDDALLPLLAVAALAPLWLYARGAERMWRRSATGATLPRWRAACFGAGWAALLAALLPPMHGLAAGRFAAHMLQHEALMVVAAPLLVLGRPLAPLIWSLPRAGRAGVAGVGRRRALRGGWRTATRPLPAFLLHGAAIWLWHLPALYQASLGSPALHAAQHAAFLGTALLFWASLTPRARRGAALCSLFATALHSGALGALLTVAARPWYPAHPAGGGLSPLEDQQLAGLVMWIPAGAAYLAAAVVVAAGWLRESGRRAAAWQARALAGAAVLALLLGGCGERGLPGGRAAALTGGDPGRGRAALRRHGCGSCHTIPGVPGADGRVGPPLRGLAGRLYLAGVLSNSPANLVRWIRDPRAVDSLTAMPALGVGEGEARDMAAYLYTLP